MSIDSLNYKCKQNNFHLRKEFLSPANEVCEGYVFTPVCQSVCLQGGSPGSHLGGKLRGLAGGVSRPTPGRKLRGLAGGSPGPHPGGRLGGLAGEVPRPTPRGVGGMVWATPVGIPAYTEAEPPLQQMATAAGGTHPTAMHSCLCCVQSTSL